MNNSISEPKNDILDENTVRFRHMRTVFFSDCMRLCDLVAFRQTYEDGEKTKTGCNVNQYIIFIIYILYIADCMLIQNFKDLAPVAI